MTAAPLWLDDAHTREHATRGKTFLQAVCARYDLSQLRRIFLSGGTGEIGGLHGRHEKEKRGGEWQLIVRYGNRVPTTMHTRQAPLYAGKAADLYDRIDQVFVDAASTLWRADHQGEALATINAHWKPSPMAAAWCAIGRQARSVKGRLVAEWFDIEGKTTLASYDEACVWQGAWALYGFLREVQLIEGRATDRYADAFADGALAEFRATVPVPAIAPVVFLTPTRPVGGVAVVDVLAEACTLPAPPLGQPLPTACQALKSRHSADEPCGSTTGCSWAVDDRYPGRSFYVCAGHVRHPPRGYV